MACNGSIQSTAMSGMEDVVQSPMPLFLIQAKAHQNLCREVGKHAWPHSLGPQGCSGQPKSVSNVETRWAAVKDGSLSLWKRLIVEQDTSTRSSQRSRRGVARRVSGRRHRT